MIAAAVAAVVLATPSREALVERWLHANRAHSLARLDNGSRTSHRHEVSAPVNLEALATRELETRGRYQLGDRSLVAKSEPWWSRPWRWLSDRWNHFWEALFARVRVGGEVAASIGDMLLVIVGLLLLFTVVRLLRNVQFARSKSRLSATLPVSAPDPQALYQKACAAADNGEYGTAVLLLFAATVALLDGRNDFPANPSATVGDLRRALGARNASLIAAFDAVASPFAYRAYAERSVDEPQWQRARTAFLTLNEAKC